MIFPEPLRTTFAAYPGEAGEGSVDEDGAEEDLREDEGEGEDSKEAVVGGKVGGRVHCLVVHDERRSREDYAAVVGVDRLAIAGRTGSERKSVG